MNAIPEKLEIIKLEKCYKMTHWLLINHVLYTLKRGDVKLPPFTELSIYRSIIIDFDLN